MKAFCNFSPGIFARATTKFAEAAKDEDDQLCSYNGRIIGSSIKREYLRSEIDQHDFL